MNIPLGSKVKKIKSVKRADKIAHYNLYWVRERRKSRLLEELN